jgi:hypothetical protein
MKQICQKLRILLLFVFLAITGRINAQEYIYSDSWGSQGFNLTIQKSTGVRVIYSIRSFSMDKATINGESMDVIQLPGNLLPNNEGAPDLPGSGRYIALPQGAVAKLNITSMRIEKFTGIDLVPAFRIPWDTEKGPLQYQKDPAIYTKNEFYPAQPVVLSKPTKIRGVDVVMLGVTPYQYNPVTKELVVYRDIDIDIEFEGGNDHFGDDRLRSRWWDPMLSDMLLNYSSLPKMNYSRSYQSTDETGCEYLIITPNGAEFQQWADSIREFRTLQGILTGIVTLGDIGGNNASTIENYINNAYNTWDIVPAACLLLADYGTNAANSITSPIWDSYCVSDNIYSDVNGDDMPDIVFARMTAQNANQLQVKVTKFIDYEKNPPVDPDFYHHPITALGFQTERWFQICSEAVAGFWEEVQGKAPVRINAVYSGNPQSDPWSTAQNTSTVVNVFGPNGLGYIPASPGQVNCTWNGTAANVVTAINNGSFMLQHRDHGYEQGWGEPAFSSSNISSLNNTDLTFVWSINCLTGKYNYNSEVFTEKFHRYTYNGQNSGALGLNAASEVSYSFVNDAYAWGAFDNMWPDFLPTYSSTPEPRGVLPAFASAAGKYFLQQSSWPYNTTDKEVTYNLFHHHGDAFMTVYSEVPQNLSVIHNPIIYAGVTSFDVTANANAFVALTVDGEIIGTATATGAPLSITIPPQQPPDQILVTITLQNFYRYEAWVEVIPPEGPYIVQNAVAINDDAGNGNGIMETAESILASITVENVGIEDATNVVVTIETTDEFVTITDNTENYGTVAAGTTAVVTDGFAWVAADNIPDLHLVIFTLNATDGTDVWTTYFAVQGHGPSLEVGVFTIDDSQGNGNGRLDPGETADFIVPTYNNGSYHAIGAYSNLISTSGFLIVNSPTYNFNVIGAGMMEEAVFSVTAVPNAPVGTAVSLIYEVISGGYEVQENFAVTIGLILEDWETGDMNQYEWQTGGNANWIVTTQNPYEGTYCAKSGNINDGQNSWISLVYDVFNNDSISFWYKVSSESSYDYLRFYIDNIEQASWSGEVGWQRIACAVTAGTHTFKWQFDKDYSVSSGSDCGWIDYIVLPAPPMTTAYAGMDAIICEGDSHQCEGAATLYNAILWTTSGSGSFDDNQSLSPVYTPGTLDVENGSVVLTLTAYSPDNTVTDNMTLTITGAPVANAGEDTSICSDAVYSLVNAAAENYVTVAWVTNGDGFFDDANLINPVYTPGAADLSAGTVTLGFTVTGSDPCGTATDEIILTFDLAASAFAGNNTETCSNVPVVLGSATAENYSALEWTTTGDGMFDDNLVLNPVYTPGTTDIENGTVILTLTAQGNGPCPAVTSELIITINPVASSFAGEDAEIYSDETYEIAGATAQNYTSLEWTSSGDGTFDDTSILNPTYTPGTNDIAAETVNLTLTAVNEECGDVSDEMTLAVNTNGIGENRGDLTMNIYPNPNSGNFVLEISGKGSGKISIKIANAHGKVIYSDKNISIGNVNTYVFDLQAEPGIYFITITGKDVLTTKKLVLQ